MGCNPLKCVCGKKIFAQRYVLVIFISFAVIISYGQRVNITMVIAEICVPPPKDNSSLYCGSDEERHQGTIEWSQLMQGILLSSFFLGYIIMQIPGTYIGNKYGARYIITSSILISSISTVLFPFSIDYTPFAVVICCRIVIGLAQASIFPNVTTLMSHWVPVKERGIIGAITFASGAFGLIIGKLVTGFIYVVTDGDWRLIFYIWGGLGLFWYMIAMFYTFSNPESHPFISQKEKGQLMDWILPKEEGLKLKIIKMIFDPPVLALLMGQLGHDYLIFFLVVNMPKYFTDVWNLSMFYNMWASSIPYILMWFTSLISEKLAIHGIKKGWKIVVIRKSYATIASFLPSICILLIPFMECNIVIVIILMCVALFTMGPFFCGLKVNIMDISHNHSGVLMAIVNGFGALAGLINPPLIGYFVSENTFDQWKRVMWVIFGVATVTNIIYLIWGRAKWREWDMNEEDAKESRELRELEKAQKKAEKERKNTEKV